MTTVKRPGRLFSFADWTKAQPTQPPPGDRLDAQFLELIAAIESTQAALADVRRDDGGIVNRSVGRDQLVGDLLEELVVDARRRIEELVSRVASAVAATQHSEQNAQFFANDAEDAVTVARQLTSGLAAMRQLVDQRASYIARASEAYVTEATDAENWANYSKAQADNAIKAKDEALQFAEYLAGPVVDALSAPAYIASSPFPHGLFYQPVEGGLAGLWSAKWWALQAQNLVGTAGIYYLGAWSTPPLPGQQNPATGQVVPNPILTGSLYYDSASGQLKVFDGLQWKQTAALAPTFAARFAYIATAGQQFFTGPDMNGATPEVGASPSAVHVNGVMLLPDEDYDVDAASSALTINTPLTVGSVVQWDLLASSASLAPGTVNAFKILPMTPDGVAVDFALQYLDPISGSPVPASVGSGAQLMVSLDGCIQEPGASYTASGSTLHFVTAPVATSALWAVWYQPGAAAP